MRFEIPNLFVGAAVISTAVAFPTFSIEERQAADAAAGIPPYQAPGPGDSRAPCPALNTLANHGYLNRNGRDITKQNLLDAFLNGFGMDNTTITLAITNAFTVCEYVTGSSCGDTLHNLTLLAEPHTFEHDHSFSRQDYNFNPKTRQHDNNQNFDVDIFETSIAVLNGASHMDFQQANEVRLQRESLQYKNDIPGWFVQNIPVQEVEAGFIFAVMGDFNLPDYLTNPQVRVDWWRYWFTNESFPTPLQWHKPSPPKDGSFVLSVSSQILHARVTSTPTPLPSSALNPNAPPATPLPATATVTILPLPTQAPYAASGPVVKRQNAQPSSVVLTVANSVLSSVISAVGPAPTFMNPYVDVMNIAQLSGQQAAASSHMSAVQSALLAAAASATPTA